MLSANNSNRQNCILNAFHEVMNPLNTTAKTSPIDTKKQWRLYKDSAAAAPLTGAGAVGIDSTVQGFLGQNFTNGLGQYVSWTLTGGGPYSSLGHGISKEFTIPYYSSNLFSGSNNYLFFDLYFRNNVGGNGSLTAMPTVYLYDMDATTMISPVSVNNELAITGLTGKSGIEKNTISFKLNNLTSRNYRLCIHLPVDYDPSAYVPTNLNFWLYGVEMRFNNNYFSDVRPHVSTPSIAIAANTWTEAPVAYNSVNGTYLYGAEENLRSAAGTYTSPGFQTQPQIIFRRPGAYLLRFNITASASVAADTVIELALGTSSLYVRTQAASTSIILNAFYLVTDSGTTTVVPRIRSSAGFTITAFTTNITYLGDERKL